MKKINDNVKEFIKFFNSHGIRFIDSDTGEEIKVGEEK